MKTKHKALPVRDLLQDQPEDFRLAQETVRDWAADLRAKLERNQAIQEFDAKNQGRLF